MPTQFLLICLECIISNLFTPLVALRPIFLPFSFYVAMSTLIGIIGSHCIGVALLWMLLIGNLALFIFAWFYSARASATLFCVFFAALGAWRFHTIAHHYAAFYTTIHKQDIELSGVVVNKKIHQHAYYKEKLIIRPTSALCNHAWCNATFLVYSTPTRCCPGDLVTIPLRMSTQPTNHAFHNYLVKEGVHASCYAKGHAAVIRVKKYNWFYATIASTQDTLLRRLQSMLSPDTFNLLLLLFFGDKTMDHYLDIHFLHWGVAHYAARSGMHMNIVASFFEYFLVPFCLPFCIKQCVIVLLGLLYALLSYSTTSFARAFAIFLLHKVHALGKRHTNSLHLLSLVLLIFLLYDPFFIFFLDFQLSFLLSFSLAWFSQSQQLNG
jgi:competence protein ComEC